MATLTPHEELRESAKAFADVLCAAVGLTGDEAERIASRIATGMVLGVADATADIAEQLHGPCTD